jgi:CubicO group peptidase (beta-lactamase class C family)
MTTPPVDLNALLITYGRPEVPLVSVAVLDDGKLYTAASPGCTPATLFQAASISKAISAFAAMALVRMGTLHLDQPVNDKLSSWKLQPAPGLSATGWAPVTLRHLLCHGGAVNVRSFPGYPFGSTPPALLDILNGVPPVNTCPVQLTGPPGVTAVYSGGGYLVLQQLLADILQDVRPEDVPEVKGGVTVANLIAGMVFRPLGMTSAQFTQPVKGTAAPAKADGHDVPGGWRIYPELTAAGVWCTPTDLVRFAAGVQTGAAGTGGANFPLTAAEGTAMLTRQLPGWGLGVELEGSGSGRWFRHEGSNEGYLCEVCATVSPGGPVVAIMTASDQGFQVLRPLMAAIRTQLKWPDPAACTVGKIPRRPFSYAQIEYLGAATRGNYKTATQTIQLDGTGFNWKLTIPGHSPLSVEPQDEVTLLCPSLGSDITVTRDTKMNATALTFSQSGTMVTATRI